MAVLKSKKIIFKIFISFFSYTASCCDTYMNKSVRATYGTRRHQYKQR